MAKQLQVQKQKAESLPTDYLHNGAYFRRNAERRIDQDLIEPNRTYAKNYLKWLELHNRVDRTISRRLIELRYILKLLGKDAKLADKEDIEDVVLTINKNSMAVVSKGRTKLTLKSFYKQLFDMDEYPKIVKWIPIDRPKNNKLPEDLLTMEEMAALIKACKNKRDKAVISILSTFGCRIGELLALRYKDLTLTTDEVSWIRFNGKTGMRDCPFTNQSLCFPYLIDYMNEYAASGPEAPLFITKQGLPFDYKNMRKLLINLKKWTKLQKRLHSHIFRFSVATLLSKESEMKESDLRMYMGWAEQSKTPAIYIKRSRVDLARTIGKITGAKNVIIEERPKPTVKTCMKCSQINAITDSFCSKCGSSLNISIMKEGESMAQMRERMGKLENAIMQLMDKIDDKTKKEIL